MSFRFIRDHAARWPIRLMCRVIEVSASGYYAWRSRPESARAASNRTLLADVRRLHAEHRGRYGRPRMHAALRAEGRTASRGRIARLMRRHGIRALAGRRFRPCTTGSRHYLPIAPNLLKQEFVAAAPNRVWLADITYIATGKGWLGFGMMPRIMRRLVGLTPCRRASVLSLSSIRCIAGRIASVVVALPPKTWPIAPPATHDDQSYHRTAGSNT